MARAKKGGLIMERSSYEVEEFFILKSVGTSRLILFFMLPFTLFVGVITFFLFIVINIFSPNLKKIFKMFLFEFKSAVVKGLTGKFEVDSENITAGQFDKLIEGKAIEHPLYGKCKLVESQIQDFTTGKTKRVNFKKSA